MTARRLGCGSFLRDLLRQVGVGSASLWAAAAHPHYSSQAATLHQSSATSPFGRGALPACPVSGGYSNRAMVAAEPATMTRACLRFAPIFCGSCHPLTSAT